MSKATKIISLLVLVGLLVCIRMFEDTIFYDPLTEFFKTAHREAVVPTFDSAKLLLNLILRFLLNTIISLAILWVIFRAKDIIKLSSILYLILFVLLFAVFCYLLFASEELPKLALFYVRRFLIQPIFLLVLLPAFYFQKKQ